MKPLPIFLGALIVIGCGGSTGLSRGAQAEQKSTEAQELLRSAEKSLDDMDPDQAEDQLEDADEILADPLINAYPEHRELRAQAGRVRKRLGEVRTEVARISLEKSVGEHGKKVEEEVARLQEAMTKLRGKDTTGADLKEAQEAWDAVTSALDDGREIEAKHEPYAKFASQNRKALQELRDEIRTHGSIIGFREGPVATLIAAGELSKESRKEKDLERRESMLSEAVDKYRDCAKDGSERLQANAGLKKVRFRAGRRELRPIKIIQSCKRSEKQTLKQLKAVRKRQMKLEKQRERREKRKKK